MASRIKEIFRSGSRKHKGKRDSNSPRGSTDDPTRENQADVTQSRQAGQNNVNHDAVGAAPSLPPINKVVDDDDAQSPAHANPSNSANLQHSQVKSLDSDPTLMSDPPSKRFSEDVADRNIHTGRFSEDLSYINPIGSSASQDRTRHSRAMEAVTNGSTHTDEPRQDAIPRKSLPGSSTAQQMPSDGRVENANAGVTDSVPARKPLATETAEQKGLSMTSQSSSGRANQNDHLDPNLRLPEGFDLTNSEDVDVATRYAPAVVHETVQPVVKHIREEKITREIHTHDYYHRILPINDVEVLPARHWVPDLARPGQLREVAAADVPGRTAVGRGNWSINVHGADNHAGTGSVATENGGPARQLKEKVGSKFTARTFENGEGETLEWTGDDGVPRSVRTWIHAPVAATWGIENGETQPLEVSDPEEMIGRLPDGTYVRIVDDVQSSSAPLTGHLPDGTRVRIHDDAHSGSAPSTGRLPDGTHVQIIDAPLTGPKGNGGVQALTAGVTSLKV